MSIPVCFITTTSKDGFSYCFFFIRIVKFLNLLICYYVFNYSILKITMS